MSSTLDAMSSWYAGNCRNDWHEEFGIRIDTLDNPGWSVLIDLDGTAEDQKPFTDLEIERSSQDWVVCRKRGSKFEAFCGVFNLDEVLTVFNRWVASK